MRIVERERVDVLFIGTLRCGILKITTQWTSKKVDMQLIPIGSNPGPPDFFYDVAPVAPPSPPVAKSPEPRSSDHLRRTDVLSPAIQTRNGLTNDVSKTDLFISTRRKNRLWLSDVNGVVQTTLKLASERGASTSAERAEINPGRHLSYLQPGEFLAWSTTASQHPDISLINLDSVSITQCLNWPWDKPRRIIAGHWDNLTRRLSLITSHFSADPRAVSHLGTPAFLCLSQVTFVSSLLSFLVHQLRFIRHYHNAFLLSFWLPSFHRVLRAVIRSHLSSSVKLSFRDDEAVNDMPRSPPYSSRSPTSLVTPASQTQEPAPCHSALPYSLSVSTAHYSSNSPDMRDRSESDAFLCPRPKTPSLYDTPDPLLQLSDEEERSLLQTIVRVLYDVVRSDGRSCLGPLLCEAETFAMSVERELASQTSFSNISICTEYPATSFHLPTAELDVLSSSSRSSVSTACFRPWQLVFQRRTSWLHLLLPSQQRALTALNDDVPGIQHDAVRNAISADPIDAKEEVARTLNAFRMSIPISPCISSLQLIRQHLELYNSLFCLIDVNRILTSSCRTSVSRIDSRLLLQQNLLPSFKIPSHLIELICLALKAELPKLPRHREIIGSDISATLTAGMTD